MAGVVLKNFTKKFKVVTAVDDVSFDLQKGDFLGLIGPNGSGKTTLVNLITSFVKPDSGKVIYQGKNITGKMPYTIANLGIARTFQMVKPFSHMAAFKNLICTQMKKSGMRWTIDGAQTLSTLRYLILSNRWEEFWRHLPQLHFPEFQT